MALPNGLGSPLRVGSLARPLRRNPTERCIALPITRSISRNGAPNAMAPSESCMPHASVIVAPVLSTLGSVTQDGIPYLAPEIQLFYKAKGLRPKDEEDFVRTLPALDGKRREWLAQSLALVHPGHAWLKKLT